MEKMSKWLVTVRAERSISIEYSTYLNAPTLPEAFAKGLQWWADFPEADGREIAAIELWRQGGRAAFAPLRPFWATDQE